ncbi:MAG: carboxypeptidase regulatory-like domain-containing protein [Planctomycetes bacterium]|nr:carboxypeptidase regulatory-like domain-containing protein [Planctomycetota bacterium]
MDRRHRIVWALAALLALAGLIIYITKHGDADGGIVNNTIQSPGARPTDGGPASAPASLPTLVLNSARTKVADEITNPPKEPSRRAPRNISGTFVDGAGKPVSGGRVFLVTGPEMNKRIREVPTDAAGNFQFVDITNTNGWIEGMRPDGALTDEAIVLSSLFKHETVRLVAGGRRGERTVLQVLYPNGSSAEKAYVFVDSGGGFGRSLRSSHAGYCSSVMEQAYSCMAVDNKFSFKQKTIYNIIPRAKNIIFQLSEDAPSTIVEVYDQKGKAITHFDYEYRVPTPINFEDVDGSVDDEDSEPAVNSRRVPMPFERASLAIWARGFFPKIVGPFEISNIPPKIRVELDAEERLRGTVTSGGRPVANATVEMEERVEIQISPPFSPQTKYLDNCTTSVDGTFECATGKEGTYSLKIRSRGFGETTIDPVEYDPRKPNTPLQIELAPAGSIEFVVEDEEGNPVPNIGIQLYAPNRGNNLYNPDSKGRLIVDDVEPGSYKYFCRWPRMESTSALDTDANVPFVIMEAGKRTVVRVKFPQIVSVTTRLVINGEEVKTGSVEFELASKGTKIPIIINRKFERLRLGEATDLMTGDYRCTVLFDNDRKPKRITCERPFISIVGKTQEVLFDIQSGSVGGSVGLETDKKPKHVRIQWKGENGDLFNGSMTTLAEGRFEYPFVPVGKCKIGSWFGKETTITVEAGKTTNVELDNY